MVFWTKFPPKRCFLSKTENVNNNIEFYIFELAQVTNFSLDWQFWFLGPNLLKKWNSGPDKKKKNEYHYWILHIWISLCPKFQLKLIILIFWTKFFQKGYFQSRAEKVNIIIEFCIFKLVSNKSQNNWD